MSNCLNDILRIIGFQESSEANLISRTTNRAKEVWREKRHKSLICLRSLCINHLLFASFIILPDRLLLGIVNNDLSELQCSFRAQTGKVAGQSNKQNYEFNTTLSRRYHLLASIQTLASIEVNMWSRSGCPRKFTKPSRHSHTV